MTPSYPNFSRLNIEKMQTFIDKIANMGPQYHKEGLPVIFLQADCLMSGVNVKVICEEKTEDIEE